MNWTSALLYTGIFGPAILLVAVVVYHGFQHITAKKKHHYTENVTFITEEKHG